jgi:glycosyltransferase involved in cell wall biosynthesis
VGNELTFKPALLCASAALTHGGSETYVLGLCRYLADRGRVRLAAGRNGSMPFTADYREVAGIPAVDTLTFPIIPRSSRFSEWLAASALSSRISCLDIETLGLLPSLFRLRDFFHDAHVLEVNYPLESIIFPFLPGKIKKIIHFHGAGLSPAMNRLKGILEQHVTLGITCSKWGKNEIKKAWPGLPVKIVHNGVDVRRFRPGPCESFNCREPYNPSLPRIGIVARLSRAKGVDLLFRAARALRGKAEFFVVGDPDTGFASELSSYGELENFHLAGPIPNNELPGFYNFLDCFVLPTLHENFPITILEAMACGLPVISSMVGGIPEIIEHGKNGILLPPGNQEELLKAIKNLVDNREIRVAMGTHAMKTVNRQFTLEHSFANSLSIYESIVGRKPPSGKR